MTHQEVYDYIYDRYRHQSYNDQEPNLYFVINNFLAQTKTDLVEFFLFIKHKYPLCPVTSHINFIHKDSDEFQAARLLGILS